MVKNLTQATQLSDSKTLVLTNTEETSGPYQPCDFVVQNVNVRFYSELEKNSTFINNLPVEITRHLSLLAFL